MRVYIAGALSSKEDTQRNPSKVVTDYIQNINRMCKVASDIRMKGHYPYVPALDLLLGLIAGNWEEKHYRDIGMEFLRVCDAILVISYSWGVQQELQLATQLGLIIYRSIEDVPDVGTR